MKSYIKAFALTGLMAAAVSCTDLDTDIKGNYTEFPDNPIAMSGAFDGCYHYQRNEAWFGRNFWETELMGSDQFVGINFNGSGWYDNGRLADPSRHAFRPDLQGVGLMGDMMSGISYTNTRIAMYGGPDQKDAAVAPLRCIRAYYTFWMMNLYGDVPILNNSGAEVIERAPRADVAKWIESELLEIIPDLTETVDLTTYSRPTKWMAEALLVKLYLNWGVYTHDITSVDNNTPNEKLNDCVKWCDALIDSGLFEVGKGYRKKFYPNNGVNTKDFIYAIEMDPAKYGANYNGGHEFWRFVGFKKQKNSLILSFYPSSSCGGIWIMTPEAVDMFNLPGDERNDMIACGRVRKMDINYNLTDEYAVVTNDDGSFYSDLDFKKDFAFKDPSKFSVGADSDLGELQLGARCWKYPPREEDFSNWGRKQTNDIPVFRYADILLTKAECILRGATATKGATAASLVNEVRDCSSAPHCTSINLDELLEERGREFIMEPWRRTDLIRFGKFENCAAWKTEADRLNGTNNMSDKTKRLYPIPTGEMNTNTNWKQNSGY